MAEFFTPTALTFQVHPDLPEPLRPMLAVARNFWWVWNPDAVEMFSRLDPVLWEEVKHNPVMLLGRVSQVKLNAAAAADSYLAHVRRVHEAMHQHLSRPGWFAHDHADAAATKIAYFSAEFGLHESLPIYSGGLGILAGDHLKSASELGVPLVAVGLLYREGYFQQYLSQDGWQQEAYPQLDLFNAAISPVEDAAGKTLRISVDVPDHPVQCAIWRVDVGRIPLFLLDTNLPENQPADRDITGRLYGGGTEMRIRQEIVLGIGGTRALAAMGLSPTVFHMNEGHSAFSALERVRVSLIANPTLTFDQVRQAVMATSIFTTHTPVPAGIDMFPPDLMRRYFKSYWPSLKLDEEGFLALGREDVGNRQQGFSMAVLAIRLADGINGVSWLHGEVSRAMWHNLWPAVPPDDVPIRHVTNGVHIRSWLSPDMAFELDRYLPDGWLDNPVDQSVWESVLQIPDEELWRAHERCRERLIAFTRLKLREQLVGRGAGFDDLLAAEEVLDPDVLTIGFARRFATYKRGGLILRDYDRLRKLLEDTARPMQLVFAGKAHPADNDGKNVIRGIIDFVKAHPHLRRRVVFLENYDINIARYFVQGVDVWLNTPRRGMEASGTSGMKAAANGVPNCSILDGWWVEGYAPDLGWAIGRGETYTDTERQDQVESAALYDLLEKQIVPQFYLRGLDKLPREWISRMKQCMRKLAPVFNTNRMVRDYTEQFYLPAANRGRALWADGLKRSIVLATEKDRLRAAWGGVRVVTVTAPPDGVAKVGQAITIDATIDLGDLRPTEVAVQIYHGPANAAGAIEEARTVDVTAGEKLAPGRYRYSGQIISRTSGRQGYAVRIMPAVADMATPFEPGLIRWN
jgi:starch phosphorylase